MTGTAEPLARAAEGTPLYVHFPFCAAKCHYCDFFSVPDEGHDVGSMVEALLAEAEARAPWRPRTVFLGGGTPSLLDPAQLTRLLDRLDALTDMRSSAVEITAECNPESLDEDKARVLMDLGVGRLSIGLQSLREETLERFGRVHSVAAGLSAVEAVRRAGVPAWSVDMIYAAPHQTPDEWRTDLARILDLGPAHLSAYNLTYEEGTRFHTLLRQGDLARLPDDVELAMFHATRELCADAGLAGYEISNYAAPGAECAHNQNYWANGPYVGIGPSAASKVGHARGSNVRSVSLYREAVAAGRSTLASREELEPLARLGETWWLGLRRASGVDPGEARETAGISPGVEDPALETARRMGREGLLERSGSRWRLTTRGLDVADGVAAEFLSV